VADQGLITRGHLPPGLLSGPESEPLAMSRFTQKEMDEKGALIQALQKTGGNQTKAAAVLGVNRVTVWNRMRKYGVDLKKIVNG
jgi:transcriptional regulator of acetoin/glycerol metabolism